MGDDGPLALGTLVAGRYEVVRAIGSGGMGHVYHVRDRDLDEDIALKLIATPNGDDWDPRHEVRLARRVTHPNVARTFDLGRHEDARFITMELVRGESLSSRIGGGRRLPLPDALRIASHLARGIVAAHAAGVVHRDLKPSNVMLDRERVVITDFGVALGLYEGGRWRGVVGTPGYMAPEQIDDGPVDGRADVYALGVVLFRMLLGRMPFKGNTNVLLAATLTSAIPDLQVLEPSIPNEVAAIVRDAVVMDRGNRIDAATFMRRLERIRGDIDQISASEEGDARLSMNLSTVHERRDPSLLPTTEDASRSGPAPGPARELYDRARRTLMAMTGPPVGEAVALLEQAHALAPDDPSILSALGMGLARLGMAIGVKSTLARAEELSIRAVLADPTRGETLSTLAFLREQQGDIQAAVRIFRAALSRDPHEASAHLFLGELLCEAGRPEGRRHFETIANGPFASRVASMQARLVALAGNHAAAIAMLEALVSIDPALALFNRRRIALWGNDRILIARTRHELEQFIGGPMEPPYPTILRIGIAGEVDPAIDITREIEASSLPARPRTWCHQIAVELLARSGQRDRALEGLLVAASLALTDLVWLDRCPPLASLRDDPRFAQARAMTSSRVHTFV